VAKLVKSLVRRTLLAKYDNLVALDDVYFTLGRLLAGTRVTGVLDAGASNGRVSRKLLRIFPQAAVYAFEPNPLYRPDWEHLTAQTPALKISHAALSDENGQMTLHITRSAGPSSFFRPNRRFRENYPEESEPERDETVQVVRLDDWCAQNGSPEIQLMKFDIQAAELRALRGAVDTLRTTLVVYTEIFFNPMYEGGALYSEIDLFLRENGFSLFNIYKPRADANGMLDQANAIFVKPEPLGLA